MSNKTAAAALTLLKATSSNDVCDIALKLVELVLAAQEDFGYSLADLQGDRRALSANKLKPAICFYCRGVINVLESEEAPVVVAELVREMHGVLNYSSLYLGEGVPQSLTEEYVSVGFFKEMSNE